ncbi:uncharacterized protein LOC110652148 isoform X2 [Hevea brasiliensis]|uniref:uncharacterized protein LOC110652148 isoform X2 n=1 Tax=Hevea brasiliensis TaxID=3981 RepID=UPI0025EED96C|nr:uncharacterized protein LOC110652148 isoform X2 [Hevea brasiliensis]
MNNMHSAGKALSSEHLSKALSLQNDDGRSLLRVAASLDVDELKSSINNKDEAGWAPLHSAASFGNLKIVEILLSGGADFNSRK